MFVNNDHDHVHFPMKVVEMDEYDKHCTSVMLSKDEEKLVSGEHSDEDIIKRTLLLKRYKLPICLIVQIC